MARSDVSHPGSGGVYAAPTWFSARFFARLLSQLLAGVTGLVRSYRHRRQVAALLTWDDRGLDDIGVTRGDVQLALGLPVAEDPSFRLRMWALERRSARLAALREARSVADCYTLSADGCDGLVAENCD